VAWRYAYVIFDFIAFFEHTQKTPLQSRFFTPKKRRVHRTYFLTRKKTLTYRIF
jgi:hypothetical protein